MIQNKKIFEFIKPNDCDMISKLSGIDLLELLYYLDNYYLELRDDLGFNELITFGLELEFENISITKKQFEFNLYELINNARLKDWWVVKDDSSLNNGLEINSPILIDDITSWQELKKVCTMIQKFATIQKNSGGHIHIGAQVLGNKITSWLNFIKLWAIYENIIFRFSYGEFLSARNTLKISAIPLAKIFLKYYQEFKDANDIKYILNSKIVDKGTAINFDYVNDLEKIKGYNTIEFRCPNGSLNEIIWQNEVNFFVSLLDYAKSDNFDHDILDNRKSIADNYIYSNLELYDEIYLQQALELADMIFNNNLDKIYFLRQYLKSFQIKNRPMVKAKKFTYN